MTLLHSQNTATHRTNPTAATVTKCIQHNLIAAPLDPPDLEQNTVRGILRLHGRWVQGSPLPKEA